MNFLSLAGYSWLTLLLCPIVLVWDSWRAFKQTIYRPYRSQRWTVSLPPRLSQPLIWIHAVSVGETQACAPLLRAVLAAYPQHGVLLTHMTPTGRDTGAALFAQEIAQSRVQQCYLSYDIWGLPQRFLKHFKPCAGIVMETEVWPNAVAACLSANIPLGLANARMSERTYRRTLKFKTIARQTFKQFAWIAAQSDQDAQRFAQLCTTSLAVTGNLKFDVQPDLIKMAQGAAFNASQARTVIALASTREGEEALLLAQLKPWLAQCSEPPLVLLIPRHPKRAPELLTVLQTQGFNYLQRSLGQIPVHGTQVYLCDTLGEMWFYYGASDIAVVGGGWLPHGGQNLIEPCIAGCAVVVGPHMFNFSDATRLAVQSGAAVQCLSAQNLTAELNRLIHSDDLQTTAERAKGFAATYTGATQAHMALLDKTLHQ